MKTAEEYNPLDSLRAYSDEVKLQIAKNLLEERGFEGDPMLIDNSDFLSLVHWCHVLETRYEVLLEGLETGFSKAGTPPKWVIDSVREANLRKGDTQDDVKMFMNMNIEDQEKLELIAEYLELDV